MLKKFLITIIFIFIAGKCLASENYYRTTADLKTRFMGMGGAYIGVPTNVTSTIYNPATYSEYQQKSAHFNIPLAVRFMEIIYSILKSAAEERKPTETTGEYEARKEKDQWSNRWYSLILGTVIGMRAAFLYSTEKASIGYNLFEESLYNEKENYYTQKFFNFAGLQNHFNSFAFSYKLSGKTSLGLTYNDYHQKTASGRIQKQSFNFGFYTKLTKNLNLGLLYTSFPKGLTDVRERLERFADNTLNLGLSYTTPTTLLALDFRNINKQNNIPENELHFGFENKLGKHFVIRAGYFKENELKNNVYSFGIGTTLFKFGNNKKDDKYADVPFYLKESSFLINYSFVREIGKTANNNFHFLSIEFPF